MRVSQGLVITAPLVCLSTGPPQRQGCQHSRTQQFIKTSKINFLSERDECFVGGSVRPDRHVTAIIDVLPTSVHSPFSPYPSFSLSSTPEKFTLFQISALRSHIKSLMNTASYQIAPKNQLTSLAGCGGQDRTLFFGANKKVQGLLPTPAFLY